MARLIHMYCGTGKGKTSAALGWALQYAVEGKTVYVECFLKGKDNYDFSYLKRLEPNIQFFNFDKFNECYNDLDEERKKEDRIHVQNGLNFARKVLTTESADVLVLDEILDLAVNGLINANDIINLTNKVDDNTVLIMTGTDRCEWLWPYVDKVTEVKSLQ